MFTANAVTDLKGRLYETTQPELYFERPVKRYSNNGSAWISQSTELCERYKHRFNTRGIAFYVLFTHRFRYHYRVDPITITLHNFLIWHREINALKFPITVKAVGWRSKSTPTELLVHATCSYLRKYNWLKIATGKTGMTNYMVVQIYSSTGVTCSCWIAPTGTVQ